MRTNTRLAVVAFGAWVALTMTTSTPAAAYSAPAPIHADGSEDAWYLHPTPWLLIVLAALALCAVPILITLRRNSAKRRDAQREDESS